MNKVHFIRPLIEKYQRSVPRYTSYPTADKFQLSFESQKIVTQITELSPKNPLSLYIHIPFCNTLCLFCGCNKIITNDKSKIDIYLDYLEREIQLYVSLLTHTPQVVQLHFGGGSPSWMSEAQISRIMNVLRRYFNLDNADEIAMEIDPRHSDEQYVRHLKKEGFSRISLGIQDFDPIVQKAVNRIQSFTDSNAILEAAHKYNFKSTNVDLIYGLPFQTLSSFSSTIDTIIKMHPERIALFNYAHIPSLLMPQTRIKDNDLPPSNVKLDILQMSVEKLIDAGYLFIGMDHFALQDDSLSQALQNGTLQRNFQGYSTFKDLNMLSFGVSSIGMINNHYYQNAKDLDGYYLNINNNTLPIIRGYQLSQDDIIRQHIIQKIMCQFKLNFNEIETLHNINFNHYFNNEVSALKILSQDGLIELSDNEFTVTNGGRFLIRNIAVVFDQYFNTTQPHRYSKSI